MKTETKFTDKKGREINIDDVITDGHIIYRVCEQDDEMYLISCTHGYHHNPDQEFFSKFNRIGVFEDLKDAFECD